MLNKINTYEPQNTSIHSMPSFIKLLWLITFIIIVLMCDDLKILLALTFMCLLAVEMARINRKIYIKTIWNLKYLFIFLILIYFFLENDLLFGVITCLRLFNIVLVSMMLILTTPPLALMEGIKKILLPLKFVGLPVNRISFSIYLAIRFIPTIMDVGSKIMKSQASRGVDYNASQLKEKILALKTMLVPLFILTVRKADNLADALEVRLYDIDADRTYIRKESVRLFDISAIVMNFMILIFLIIRVW